MWVQQSKPDGTAKLESSQPEKQQFFVERDVDIHILNHLLGAALVVAPPKNGVRRTQATPGHQVWVFALVHGDLQREKSGDGPSIPTHTHLGALTLLP
jgi:hypothetical protein